MKELWKHQAEAVRHGLVKRDYGLFFDPGTGKTRTAIEILRGKFKKRGRLMRTLVLCPPVVVRNWRDEWLMYSKVKPEDVITLVGEGKKRAETFYFSAYDRLLDNTPLPRIFITNYESMLMEKLFNQILAWKPEVIILDEAHMIKSHSAKRTKQVLKLTALAEHRYILTGTPVLNSPMDLFTQFLALDNGLTFGKNFFAFRGKYFLDKNAGMPKQKYFPNWVPMNGALDAINKAMLPVSARAKKEECLDLPPLVMKTIKVPMLPEQRRMYEEMKRDFITFVDDVECVATMAMTKATRLMQIASGFAKTVDGKERSIKNTPKMEALRELLEEIVPGNKVIVWAYWRENYEQIEQVCDSLSIKYACLYGGISERERDSSIRSFNTDPTVRVLIGNPGSGGVGVNLIAASYSIVYSRTYALVHELQSIARNYRGGSEIHEKITRIDLITEDSIEEKVLESLHKKEDMTYQLLRKELE